MSIASDGAAPQSLPSLQELSRIMDVASTLRRERDTAMKQFSVDETRAMLRQRLLEAAELAGESLSGDEVDAAISQYYENLHAFKTPEPSWRISLATLYVRRQRYVWRAVAVLAVVVLLLWGAAQLSGAPLLDSGSSAGATRLNDSLTVSGR